MWPFDDEPQLDEITSDFDGVASSIFEIAETEEAGLMALQDAYKSYEFEDPTKALEIFQNHSSEVRKKFGDTKPFDFNTTMELAPRNFEEFTSDLEDPDENKIDIINKWETENLKTLSESEDLNYKQLQPQLERSIKQSATMQRRQIYGSDNYLVTDQALRVAQGAIGPIASLVGAESVEDFFTENTDPDGASVFGYVVGGDDSYWSAISSGVGSVAGAVGSGVATGGWGTVGYLAASGAGSVRNRVEDAIENEASTEEAIAAGGIEALSQAGQVFVGGKVFGKAVNKILGKSTNALGERIFPKVLKAGALEGGAEGAGQIVSNVGQNVGRGDDLDKDLLEGVDKSLVAGFVGGSLATGGAELFAPNVSGQPSMESLDARAEKDLRDPGEDVILETEGSLPPKPEAIPGKTVSTELLEPPTPRATLSDGSEIVESDGKAHLVKDGKVLQAYEQVKYVTPEVAAKLKQAQADGNPDGTAFTLTTDGENLIAESEFIKDDLTPSGQKTGKSRVVIPTSETEQGSVPIFVSETRTSDGVRQNPSFIGPGTVESTASAAKAGYNQYISPYMQRMLDKYGPELSEELGLSVESFEENADGTLTSVQTPLKTKFKTTHAESGDDAAGFINERGILGSLEYFNENNKFNKTDAAVANIVVSKLEQLHSKLNKEFTETQSMNALDKLSKAGDLLSTAIQMKDKVGTTAGQFLGSLTNTADEIHNSRAKGEFRVAQLEHELTKKAYVEFEKQTGEKVNIQGWSEEAQLAKQELKEAESEIKEGETAPPNVQEKINQAKEKYDKAVNKILNTEKLRQEKLKDFDPKAQKNLRDMYDLLGRLDGELKFKYAEKVLDEEIRLGKEIDSDSFENLFNFFRSNLLSGPSTQLRNLVGNTSKFMSDIVGLVGTGEFKMAGVYMQAWLGETGTSLKEAREIVEGHRAGRFKFDQKTTDSKGNIKEVQKIAPLNNPFTAVQNAMYRLLTAQDAVFFRNSTSAMAHLAEYAASKNIKDPKERKAYIEKALGYDREGKVKEQVQKEAQMLRDAGIEVSQRQIDLDVAYRTEQLRSDRTQEIAQKFGERSVFINDPTGVMGALYSALETGMDKLTTKFGDTTVKPLKFLMPFTRVAANITSHIMEFTPVGILKANRNNPNEAPTMWNHQLEELDAKMVMGRGIVGSTFMAGFFAFAHAFKDDEDPAIAFYGYPPKGKWKEWQAKGIPIYSMKIGDNIIPLQGTSLAILPAVLGGAMESIKNGADVIEAAQTAALASLGAVSTMSFLKPAGELFDHLMGSKYGSSEPGAEESGTAAKRSSNYWKAQADTLASGFIPASGFLNNLGRYMNESPLESYNNLAAKVFGEMPFASSLGDGPQLNIFGEPITKSLVQRFSAGLAPHTIKTDPVLLWMQETGFSIPDQGPIVSLTRKVEKENFGEIQKTITKESASLGGAFSEGYGGIMDEEQSRRVLQISGPQIKEYLDSIRRDPNFQVKGPTSQKLINKRINDIRAEAKMQVLSN